MYPRFFLSFVSGLGWLLSRLGPVGHDLRDWANDRLQEQRRG